MEGKSYFFDIAKALALICVIAIFLTFVIQKWSVLLSIVEHIQKIEGFGVSLELKEELRAIKTDVRGDEKFMPEVEIDTIQERANWIYPVLESARILWVDDNPKNNNNITEVFNLLRMVVRYARTNDEALHEIKAHKFDVIISDLGRDYEVCDTDLKDCPVRWFEDEPIGIRHSQYPGFCLAEHIATDQSIPEGHKAPIIFYSGVGSIVTSKCSPLVTDLSYELINKVFDILERKRSSKTVYLHH